MTLKFNLTSFNLIQTVALCVILFAGYFFIESFFLYSQLSSIQYIVNRKEYKMALFLHYTKTIHSQIIKFTPIFFIVLLSCTTHTPTPPRDVSLLEAQGLLNNDFGAVISLETPPPEPLTGAMLFEIQSSPQIIEEITKRGIPKGKEIVIYSLDNEKLKHTLNILQKEGYRVGILKVQE